MIYKFDAIIQQVENKDATFIEIPFDVEKEFGAKRVKVKAKFDNVDYRGSIVRMGMPCFMIGLTKEIRKKIGKGIGDTVSVEIEKDEEERRGAVKPTGGVAEPSGYPEYRQRQQQDVTGDDVVEPEAAQERHALQGIVFRYLFREIIVCGDKKRDTESEEEQQCYEMYT